MYMYLQNLTCVLKAVACINWNKHKDIHTDRLHEISLEINQTLHKCIIT